MHFRSLPLLAGFVAALSAALSTQASADTYYSDRWLPGTSVGGVSLSGGFVYDATTGGVSGDTSSIPGFCSSGACGLSIVAQNALTLSGSGGGLIDVAFNVGPTFRTIGSNPILTVMNLGAPDILGGPGLLSSTGGLNVSPAFVSEQWSANATIGGVPITGGFLYNATNGTIISSNTSIAGFCASATCVLSIVAQNALTISAPGGGLLDIAFNVGPTFQTIGSNPILTVMNLGAPDILGGPGVLSSTGSLILSPALAPASGPAPGVGLASLLALAGAMFGSRRLRNGLTLRG
jgi:hypothetical protein